MTEEEIADEIIDEILDEEAIAELATLTIEPRRLYLEGTIAGYSESDKDFLSSMDNHRAAALLLGIHIRKLAREKRKA